MAVKHAIHTLAVGLISASLFGFAGCSGGEDDDDPELSNPTPTPTPVEESPSDYRVSAMVIGDSSQGVDLNGDGSVDNSIDAALTGAQEAIHDGVDLFLDEQGIEPAQQIVILESVDALLEATLSVEALSEAINRPIQTGARHYLMSFDEAQTATLIWGIGEFRTTFYAMSQEIGRQAQASSDTYGPGDLTLKLTLTNPRDSSQNKEIDLVLQEGLTVVSSVGEETIQDARTGGAMAIADLSAMARNVLTTIDELVGGTTNPETGEPIDIPVEEIVLEVETRMAVYADIDLDGDGTNDASSVGLLVNADAVPVE